MATIAIIVGTPLKSVMVNRLIAAVFVAGTWGSRLTRRWHSSMNSYTSPHRIDK